MIHFTKNNVNLVVPLGTLESLVYLQTGLLRLIGRQSEDDLIGVTELGAVANLLEATLFDVDQLAKIETMFQKKEQARSLSETA